jgi:FHA domain
MTEPWGAARHWVPAEHWEPAGQPAQAPASPRSRMPWVIAACAAGVWVLLYVVTGSLIGATALQLLLVALGVAIVLSLRSLGVGRDNRRIGQMAGRWSDGRDRPRPAGPASGRLSPGGSPSAGQLEEWPQPRWSPQEWSPATGCSVPYCDAMGTRAEPVPPGRAGPMTVAAPAAPAIPMLRLVTGDTVAQTRRSGARAGRGEVDLVLPQVATVSREHARFSYVDGQWWVANLGRNGLTLNGTPLAGGGHPLHDGDSIRWGMRPDALASRVEIG